MARAYGMTTKHNHINQALPRVTGLVIRLASLVSASDMRPQPQPTKRFGVHPVQSTAPGATPGDITNHGGEQ